MKKYVAREQIPESISQNLKAFHPFVRDLLYGRNIIEETDAQRFLNPDYDLHTHDPFLLKNMEKVVDRIFLAMEKNEKIAIYSDYDADGIPGAVVLHDCFKKISYENFVNYIPLRNEEGFGLNKNAITDLCSQGATLLITIDCGITDVEEVSHALECGIDVIITDHHIPGALLPKAFAIINPKLKGDEYPEKMLCGSGVIFKVVQALLSKGAATGRFTVAHGQEKWMLDMVGLATLSDMVPLVGENRVFAYYGMTVLHKSPRVGLMKLFSLLKIQQQNATEDDIAFMITPRINAASRMGIPLDAFKLLSTTDEVEAEMLALHLHAKNDERKGVVAGMVKEIKKKIQARENGGEHITGIMREVLVIGNPYWKPSLLGLVANSFSDEHNRPVFLWGREGEKESDEKSELVIKGSCRAGGDTNVVALMERVKDVFIEYGGHKGAGGFSVSQEHIHTLEERLNIAYAEMVSELNNGSHKISETVVDKKLSLDDVNWQTYTHVEKFAPFGCENPKPLFLFENIIVASIKLFGKEKNHLEIKFKNSKGKDVTAMAFFSSPEKFSVPVNIDSRISLVATIEKSMFRNFPELRLRIVDIF